MNSLDALGFIAFIRRGGIPSPDEAPIPRGPPPPGPPARSGGPPGAPGCPGTPGIRGPRGCSTGSTRRRFFGNFARAYQIQIRPLIYHCFFLSSLLLHSSKRRAVAIKRWALHHV